MSEPLSVTMGANAAVPNMASALPANFRLADVLIASDECSLTRAGETFRIEPRVLALLRYLAARPNQIVTREEILANVWAGVVVSEDAINYSISQLRKLLGDSSRQSRLIETLPRRGYRLLLAPEAVVDLVDTASPIGDITSSRQPSTIAATPEAKSRSAAGRVSGRFNRWWLAVPLSAALVLSLWQFNATPAPRALALLPTTSGAELAAEAADITDLLRLGLAGTPELQLSGRNSTAVAMQRAQTPAQLMHELAVPAVLQTRLVRAGEQWHLELMLHQRHTDRRWHKQINGTGSAHALVQPALHSIREYLALSSSTSPARSTHEQEIWLLGMRQLEQQTPEMLTAAESHFRRAVQQRPDAALLWTGLAETLTAISESRWQERPTEWLVEARAAAETALRLEPRNADAGVALARVAFLQGQIEETQTLLRKVLERAPHHSVALARLAGVAMQTGRLELADQLLKRAVALDPLDGSLRGQAGLLATIRGELMVATSHYRQQQQLLPQSAGPHRNLAGIQQQMGAWRDALENFRQCIEKGYSRPVGLLEIASLQRRLGNEHDAASWAAAALPSHRAEPDDIDDWIMQYRLLTAGAGLAGDPLTRYSPLASTISDFHRGNRESMRQLARQSPEAEWWLNPRSVRVAHYSPALYAYAALQQTEPALAASWRQRLQQLLDDKQQSLQAFHGRYYIQAQLAAIDRRPADAISALRSATERGFRDWPRLQHDPFLASLWPALQQQAWFSRQLRETTSLRQQLLPEAKGWSAPHASANHVATR